jgi:PAS domain S-box-containing protein
MSTQTPSAPNAAAFLEGGGELGALIRAKDWSATPLGRPEAWPWSVKVAVSLCLNSRVPILLWLGPELRILYNDAYIPFLGEAKHPAMLGAPGREAWGEIWDAIGPMLDEARAGRATWVEDFQMFFARRLPREEVYVTFSYGPLLDVDGRTVEGVFCACTETTERVVGEQRLATLCALSVRASQQHTVEAACRHAIEVLDGNPLDIAFAAIYLADGDARTARRIAATRLPPNGAPAFPAVHGLSAGEAPWPFTEATHTGSAVEIPDLPSRVGAFAAPLWPDPVRTAIVLPLPAPGQAAPAGFLVVGVSSRRVLDADYRGFLDLATAHIGSGVAEARAFEEERRRAEARAELDQAKTAFFSNVSHEFRTPLTLMLGPLEELLAKPPGDLPPDGRALAEVAHRNGLCLLRLVNTLLDFSRIEAGRAQASYKPTDLARRTAELASSFRSACERAGLSLDVACPALPEPVYVDRDMWEKIVLDLLSNAFKFTLEGGIAVRLAAAPGGAELRVNDTGTGIPAADLPRIFERFQRIDGQKSRSREGSGIGLALVQELVRLHGGTIAAESEPCQGTTFSVTVPFGTAHLPPDRIGAPRATYVTPPRASAYVEEALRWPPQEGQTEGEPLPQRDRGETEEVAVPAKKRAAILLADDNADMRDYLARLLSAQGWEVEAVLDGDAALAAARRRRPDLVLTDVMMPGPSGLELAVALRQLPGFAEVPVILLSARAGEEARIEGLWAGPNDYLVKPFAVRELIARVNSHLSLARLRREAAERVRRSEVRLQPAIDLVGLSPYSWDPATGALEWDDRLRALWGLPPGAPVDAGVFLSAIHPDDRARVEAAIAACTDPAGDGVYHLEYRVIGIGDEVERWVSTHGQTFFEEGRAVSFVGAALDITEQKRAEERLRASEERFRRFAEHSTNVLWILDANTMRVEYLSPAYERVWGEPPGRMTGHGIDRCMVSIHPDDRECAAEFLDRARGGGCATVEYRIIRPGGAVRWIRNAAFPIRDGMGRVQWIGGIAQDLTRHDGRLVYVVDADEGSRERFTRLLRGAGYAVKAFASKRAFLEVAPVLVPGCVVLDIVALGKGGLAVPRELKARRISLPVIVTGGAAGDAAAAVEAMKLGAADWLGPASGGEALLAAVASALAGIQDKADRDRAAALARTRIAVMAVREREVLAGMMAGNTNKSIARRLGISPRTVEIHRAHVMERLGASTLPEAVLLAAAAGFEAEAQTSGPEEA